MATGTRQVGEFCWINMLTPKPAEAQAFFGKLLRWTFAEIPDVGRSVHVGEHAIGGLFDLADPKTPPGTPPHIGVMVRVDSADAVAERVKALGGRVQPPFDVWDQGRMAVCADPNGAWFDVWEPRKLLGTDVDGSRHGAPSWFETMTSDVDRAAKFYAELFDWVPEAMPMPDFTYTTFKLGAAYVAGMMPILPQMGPMQPHWGTYFTVDDADVAAREAVDLGATLCVPAMDIPDVGRFCGITSPQGVTFYVIKYVR